MDIQSFLGFASYYRRFIKNFAEIANPLTEATKLFKWESIQQNSFETLKDKLTSPPLVLSFSVFGKGLFILDTDASDIGMGSVLSQVIGNKEKVIAYGSKTLSQAEKSYCTTRKELLSVVVFTEKFKCYLQEAHFIIRNDH